MDYKDSSKIMGENIRNRRKELKMTQKQLAEKLGYASRVSVCTVEKGKENLSTSRLRMYAEALETTPAHLMGYFNNNSPSRLMEYYSRLIEAFTEKSIKEQQLVCQILDVPYSDLEELDE